jgi:hypothetical protein
LGDERITNLLGDKTVEDLLNAIEGIWVLHTHNYTRMD